jgi:hypothetical protein
MYSQLYFETGTISLHYLPKGQQEDIKNGPGSKRGNSI